MHTVSPTGRFTALVLSLLLTACGTATVRAPAPSPVQSIVRESADLADVTADAADLAVRLGKEHVLMVFDIDNTLLAMEQGLGSDQWYEWQKELSSEDPCDPRNTGNRFAVQGALFFASAMRPTQADAAVQVRNVQALGIPVIVVSSRGPDYRLPTFRELRRNGMDFSRSAIGPPNGYDKAFVPVPDGRASRYEDGVFMTAGQHKGRMLYALLTKTGTRMPAAIVVADDKRKNIDAVMQTFSTLGVAVHGWRYSAEDRAVRSFDADKAAAQWQAIDGPLRQIQHVLGPDNYDLDTAVLPAECRK